DGGSINGDGGQKVYSVDPGEGIEYTSGTEVTAVPDEGFVFMEWSDNDSTEPSRTDTGENGNVDAEAIFSPIIVFNSQGGSAVDSLVAEEGLTVIFPTPTRTGY